MVLVFSYGKKETLVVDLRDPYMMKTVKFMV